MRKKTYPGNGASTNRQLIPELIRYNPRKINIADGCEFLDDRIRLSDPLPIYQTQTATENG